jgi:HAD superfamily phosphatase (TIGR01668 family)
MFLTLQGWLKPDFEVDAVEQIDLQAWWQAGLRGLILDVDDTLTLKNSPRLAPAVQNWLQQAQQLGFQCFLVSNNRYPEHIAALSERLAIPGIAQAGKPRPRGFVWAMQQSGLPPEQLVAIGDRVLTDILGAGRLGLKTCLVRPVTPSLSAAKQILYNFEKRLAGLPKNS